MRESARSGLVPKEGGTAMLVRHGLGVLCGLVGWSVDAVAQTPSLTLIGVPGQTNTFLTGISADGQTASGWAQSPNEFGFTWTRSGGINAWGTLPNVPQTTRAFGISGDGSVSVGQRFDSSTVTRQAFRYGPGGYETLGPLPPNTSNPSAIAANNDGSVIVGTIGDSQNFVNAMRWTRATGMQQIGVARPGDIGARFTGISRDGTTAIGISGPGPTGTQFDAFTWTEAGGWRQLPVPASLPQASDIRVIGVNVDGSLAVGGIFSSDTFRSSAVLWRNGQPSVLPALGAMWDMGSIGVSDNGEIIVGSGRDVPNSPRDEAVIWIGGQPWTLASYLTSLGVVLPPSTRFDRCRGVSADGNTIFGDAILPGGATRGFIATIPSTSTVAVLAVSGILILRRRRERQS